MFGCPPNRGNFNHPFACSLAAHIYVAIIGITHEVVTALLQFFVQDIKHQIRQQGRKRAALRGTLLRRPDQSINQHPRGYKAADQLQNALVGNPFCHQPHQDVVIDSIEKFLEVQIYDDGVTRRDQLLRLLHRLMRRASRPEAVAVLGERRVPSRLQHLQRRLLDESVDYTRNPEQTSAARGLRYLDPPHRLRLVSAVK